MRRPVLNQTLRKKCVIIVLSLVQVLIPVNTKPLSSENSQNRYTRDAQVFHHVAGSVTNNYYYNYYFNTNASSIQPELTHGPPPSLIVDLELHTKETQTAGATQQVQQPSPGFSPQASAGVLPQFSAGIPPQASPVFTAQPPTGFPAQLLLNIPQRQLQD